MIHCDNTSAINMSKNPIMHSNTKHIPIKYQYLIEHVSQKDVKFEYITQKNILLTFSINHYLRKPLSILDKRWEPFLYKSTKRRKHNLKGKI